MRFPMNHHDRSRKYEGNHEAEAYRRDSMIVSIRSAKLPLYAVSGPFSIQKWVLRFESKRTLLPSSTWSRLPSLEEIPNSKARLDEMNDEERNKIVLPSSDDTQPALNIVPVARVEIELQNRREPILRCPGVNRIRGALNLSSNAWVDSLAVMIVGDDEDVNQRGEGEQKTKHIDDEPEAV